MPSGNISQVERIKKMTQIRDLADQGLSNTAIAEKVGMEIQSIKRMKIYIDELAISELSSKEISNKRAELYIEVTEAAIEARSLFDKFKEWIKCGVCKGKGEIRIKGGTRACPQCKGLGGYIRTGEAKKFFDAWMDSIDRRMRLYGLDNIKGGDIILNQQVNANQYMPPDKINVSTAAKISDILKGNHEATIQDKYESTRDY